MRSLKAREFDESESSLMSNNTLKEILENLDRFNEVIEKNFTSKRIDSRIVKDLRQTIDKHYRLESVQKFVGKAVIDTNSSKFKINLSNLKLSNFETSTKLNFLNKSNFVNASVSMSCQFNFKVENTKNFFAPKNRETKNDSQDLFRDEFSIRKHLIYYSGVENQVPVIAQKNESMIIEEGEVQISHTEDVIDFDNKKDNKKQVSQKSDKNNKEMLIKNIRDLNVSDSLKARFLSGINN